MLAELLHDPSVQSRQALLSCMERYVSGKVERTSLQQQQRSPFGRSGNRDNVSGSYCAELRLPIDLPVQKS